MVVIYNFTGYLHTLFFFNEKIISFSTLGEWKKKGKKLEEDSAGKAECAVVFSSASYVSLQTERLVCDLFSAGISATLLAHGSVLGRTVTRLHRRRPARGRERDCPRVTAGSPLTALPRTDPRARSVRCRSGAGFVPRALGHTSLLVPAGAEEPLGHACVPGPGLAGGSLWTAPT